MFADADRTLSNLKWRRDLALFLSLNAKWRLLVRCCDNIFSRPKAIAPLVESLGVIMALAAHSMATSAAHFSVKARDGKARCGVLTTKNGSVDTPAVLLYTRRGGPLSLTSPDMVAAVTPPVQGVQLSAMHL